MPCWSELAAPENRVCVGLRHTWVSLMWNRYQSLPNNEDLKGRCAGQTNCVPDYRLSNCLWEFLVHINEMITSGWIPDLFPKEDLENILGSIANEQNLWEFQITQRPEPISSFRKWRRTCMLSLRSPPWGIHSEFELDDPQASLTILPWSVPSFKMWTWVDR